MLLQLTHSTSLTYSDLIAETVMELRVAPRHAAQQLRLAFTLGLGPMAAVSSYLDWLGNLVHVFTVSPFHREVQIVATSLVDTQKSAPNLSALPDTWPLEPLHYTLYDYRQFSGPITPCPALADLAAALRPTSATRLADLAVSLMECVHHHITYVKGVTTASTPVTDVLEQGQGVCQDFTHVMIALARTLGIPARYVSGIVHSGGNELRGAAQTHAWCELFFPSLAASSTTHDAGWIGFDPTNNTLVDERFVVIGLGRDYRDVPPNRGVYKGKAFETIAVEVTTQPLAALPPSLIGERITTLRVPTYPDILSARPLVVGQISEQQQQQQQQEQQQQ